VVQLNGTFRRASTQLSSIAVPRPDLRGLPGTKLELRDETTAEHHKFILTPNRFVRPRERVVIQGGAAMRAFVGLPRPSETDDHASESGTNS
jgi:hypothetical protein